jgi:hypothetical protein
MFRHFFGWSNLQFVYLHVPFSCLQQILLLVLLFGVSFCIFLCRDGLFFCVSFCVFLLCGGEFTFDSMLSSCSEFVYIESFSLLSEVLSSSTSSTDSLLVPSLSVAISSSFLSRSDYCVLVPLICSSTLPIGSSC